MSIQKQLIFLYRRAPHGTIYAWETLQTVLIGAAFEQAVSLVFIDDGVFQLLAGSDTRATGMKNFMPIYRALGDYDVQRLCVDQQSLTERGLTPADLSVVEEPETGENMVKICDTPQIRALLTAGDVIFST